LYYIIFVWNNNLLEEYNIIEFNGQSNKLTYKLK